MAISSSELVSRLKRVAREAQHAREPGWTGQPDNTFLTEGATHEALQGPDLGGRPGPDDRSWNQGPSGGGRLASSQAGSIPVGTGLNGFFYDRDDPPFVINSLAVADNILATSAATATFRATLLDYPNGAQNVNIQGTVAALLGADAASLMPAGTAASQASPMVMRFTGFINIADAFDMQTGNSTIDVNFSFGSDGGVRLRIGGQTVFTVDGIVVSFPPPAAEVARFEAPGLYPVEIVWYDHFGGIGLEWYSSIPGGPNSGASAGTVGIVPTSVLSPQAVPEPSTLAGLVVGVLSLLGYRGRRRMRPGALAVVPEPRTVTLRGLGTVGLLGSARRCQGKAA